MNIISWGRRTRVANPDPCALVGPVSPKRSYQVLNLETQVHKVELYLQHLLVKILFLLKDENKSYSFRFLGLDPGNIHPDHTDPQPLAELYSKQSRKLNNFLGDC